MKRKLQIGIVLVGVLVGLGSGAYMKHFQHTQKLERLSFDGHHQIYVALWNYQFNNKAVPASINELVDSGYLEGIPLNPYTSQPMQGILPGGTPADGDFAYIRDSELPGFMPDDLQKVEGFFLLGLGRGGFTQHADFDGDGVPEQFDYVVDEHPLDVVSICGNTDMLQWTAAEILDCWFNGTVPGHYASYIAAEQPEPSP